ncbi:hypothetical protein ABFX02_13G193000 [Erythranthe guttata]
MPKELPGFYYDEEKNRYFPYKGPIPGSSRKPPPIRPSSDPKQQADDLCQTFKIRPGLLHAREFCGNVIYSFKKKLSFQAEYQKRHASQPTIWKYKRTKKMANISLGHVVADVILPHGLEERDILLSCGAHGLVCVFQAANFRQEINSADMYEVDRVRPLNLDQTPRQTELLRELGSSFGSTSYLTSDISCLAMLGKSSLTTDGTMSKRFLITTLGSDIATGSVYLLDLSEPLDFSSPILVGSVLHGIAGFKQTLWTADSDPRGTHAAIGTSRGVVLLNIETGASTWAFDCKSDVFSLQLNQSGNSMLCGLRNGKIVTVDTRQRQMKKSARSSSVISMPSSVCCLTSLEHWDQYFLASSMDGSMKLYDRRLTHRGAVQSYEGNVNSHTRIQLGVDPAEKVVMSGGEDCNMRMWNIKSGELLLRDRFMDSIPSAVCWSTSREKEKRRSYWEEHGMGAWVGSYEGIFYMDWL